MKALVIGCTGFLGSALITACDQHSWQIWGTALETTPKHPRLKEIFPISQLGLQHQQYDVVFIAAGNYAQTHQELLNSNVQLAIQASAQFPDSKIVYISSAEVYGKHTEVISERSAFNNPSIYGRAKLAGEFCISAHVKYAIIRLTYLYDISMQTPTFLPTIIKSARETGLITLTNHGEREQDYLHVDDAAKLCFLAATTDQNQVYLGATGTSYNNAQIAKTIVKQFTGCRIVFSGQSDAASMHFNSDKTKQQLQWQPKHDVITDLGSLQP